MKCKNKLRGNGLLADMTTLMPSSSARAAKAVLRYE